MNPPRPPAPPPAEDARARLLAAGLRLFAHQGFAKTSTRELAEAANVNVASISYYFGDKAGLYRAVFTEPLGSPEQDLARVASPGLSLRQALHGFYAGFLEPLREGDVARQCMKLHFREMLEPTGLCDVNEALGIEPMHRTLVDLLRRHLRLVEADDELQRLAIAMAGLGVQVHVCRDINDQLAPQLHQRRDALEGWAGALLRYALAMVSAEATQRGLPMADPDTPLPPP